MARIALDATYAAFPQRTGTGVYSWNLIRELSQILTPAERSRHDFVLGFRPGPYFRWARNLTWPDGFTTSLLLDSWLRVPSAALFHGLNQRLPQNSYPASVVTLHERFPSSVRDFATPEFQRHMSARIEHAIHKAGRIIAVSDSVRQQLLQYDSALLAKTVVIHHGVSPAQPASPAEIRSCRERLLGFLGEEKFFLNIGAVQYRKNIAGILQALQSIPNVYLVLAGADGFGAEQIHKLIRTEGLSGRVRMLGHQPPEILRLLYSSATALIFPSFEEAFGLPILEAMSYGLPVITSNFSAMPEVAGNAALLVAPHNTPEIREAMQRILDDSALASTLSEKGRHRASLFSWGKCAKETIDVYQDLLTECSLQ